MLRYALVYDSEDDSDVEHADFFTDLEQAKRALLLKGQNLKPEILELTGRRWKLDWKESQDG